jgi:hypothetical protein
MENRKRFQAKRRGKREKDPGNQQKGNCWDDEKARLVSLAFS